jgi:hypothetical protein
MGVACSYNQVGELTVVTPSGTGGDPYRDIEFEKSARSDEEDLKNGDYEGPEWLDAPP